MTPADMSDYESDDVGDLIVKRPRWRKAEETEALMELDKNILPRDHWALVYLQREDNLSALKMLTHYDQNPPFCHGLRQQLVVIIKTLHKYNSTHQML